MKTKSSTTFRLVVVAAMLAMLLSTTLTASAAVSADYRYWDPNLAPGTTPQYAWANGSLGSGYTEGEAAPMNLKITGLTAGTYAFNIWYDWYNSQNTTCGVWKITQFNNDVTNTSWRDDVAAAPDNSGGVFPETPGQYIYVGTTGGSVDVTTITGPGAQTTGNLTQHYITVVFDVTGAGTVDAWFYWGVYFSLKNQDLGNCNGITSFPGKSSQTKIVSTPTVSGATMIGGGGTISIDTSAIAPAAISGVKYYDLDGDHSYDTGEPLLEGWEIKACTDASCTTVVKIDSTSLLGVYSFNLANGTYYVCETLQTDWVQSEPIGGGCYGPIIVADNQLPNQDFGNYWNADWGDLPDPLYNTLYASTGAAHIVGNLRLGAQLDIEPQGQQSPNAVGDDALTSDDEDGVLLTAFTDLSKILTIQVVCTSPTLTSATVVVWFDWDNNGSLAPAEITFNSIVSCSPGGTANTLSINYSSFATASGYVYGDTMFYRARLYETVTTPLPTGVVTNGEVEDYRFDAPTAVEASDPSSTAKDYSIQVDWQTFDETNIVGFNLYRSTSRSGLGRSLVYSTSANNKGIPLGDSYSFTDTDVQAGVTYYYWLVVQKNDGSEEMAPTSTLLPFKFFLPVIFHKR